MGKPPQQTEREREREREGERAWRKLAQCTTSRRFFRSLPRNGNFPFLAFTGTLSSLKGARHANLDPPLPNTFIGSCAHSEHFIFYILAAIHIYDEHMNTMETPKSWIFPPIFHLFWGDLKYFADLFRNTEACWHGSAIIKALCCNLRLY